MAENPTNLILEQFRVLRDDIATVGSELNAFRAESGRGMSNLSGRMDALETEVRGVSYVATVSIGSVLADMNDLKRRVKRLEDA